MAGLFPPFITGTRGAPAVGNQRDGSSPSEDQPSNRSSLLVAVTFAVSLFAAAGCAATTGSSTDPSSDTSDGDAVDWTNLCAKKA